MHTYVHICPELIDQLYCPPHHLSNHNRANNPIQIDRKTTEPSFGFRFNYERQQSLLPISDLTHVEKTTEPSSEFRFNFKRQQIHLPDSD